MNESAPNKLVFYLVWIAIILYSLTTIVYAIEGAQAATGLPGYLISFQLQLLGTASWKTAALVSIMCYMIPLALACKLVSSLAPAQMAAFLAASEAMRGEPPIFWLTWQFIFAVSGVLLLATLVVSAMLYFQMQLDRKALVYALDLDHGSVPPGREAKFVTLTGHLSGKFVSAYQQGDNLHVIAPVTDAHWTPGEPVRYFVHHMTYGPADKPALPEAFRKLGAATFPGKLGDRLPVFVQREYKAKGLQIDPSYSVIDWADLPNDAPQSIENVYVALVIGGMLTSGAFLIMAMMRVRRQVSRKWTS